MGHTLNSLSSSYKYENTEYKQYETKNIITCDDSTLTSQIKTTLPNVVQSCDRTVVSDRSTAILINAVLRNMEVITIDDS